jgi:hypothetical protein
LKFLGFLRVINARGFDDFPVEFDRLPELSLKSIAALDFFFNKGLEF